MSDQEKNAIYSDAIVQDREIKKQLVVDTITSHCVSSSRFEDLRLIGEALEAGDKLVAKVLTGGWCNFSYRVHLIGNPQRQVYAKLAFTRALWNPDPDAHYDLKRVENEFQMMELFHKMSPGSVAVPYLCIDIDDMKLLVTQWSPSDEQFANQFIDGVVDLRIIPNLASGLAKLNTIEEYDLNYGYEVKDTLKGFYTGQTKLMQSFFDTENNVADRVISFAKELGYDTCANLANQFLENLFSSNSLAHSDTHVFNILVEKKPDVSSLENFGPNGSYALCDWEMAMSCSLGRDVGLFYAFPMACIITHAANGNKQNAVDMLNVLDVFWTEYAAALIDSGKKTEADLLNVYKTVMGQVGSFIFFIYYNLGIQMEFLPLEGDKLTAVKESLGYIGLNCLHFGFGDEYDESTLDDIRSRFLSLVHKEIERHSPVRPSRLFMRSSMLRASGRRVSDAGVFSGLNSDIHFDEN